MFEKLVIRDGRVKFPLFCLVGCCALIALGLGQAGSSLLDPAFVVTCILMGLGLGIDVMCLMISQARTLKSSSDVCMLAYRTAIGHMGFPMLGAIVCLTFAAWIGALSQIIGIAGFALIVFVYFKEGLEAVHSEKEPGKENDAYLRGAQWGLVVAVSLDSLLYGPVFSAEATQAPTARIPAAFIAAGLIVGLLGASAGLASVAVIRRASGRSARAAARMQYWGLFTELSVIGYFGMAALLRSGFALKLPAWILGAISVGTTALFFTLFGSMLWRKQLAQAEASFAPA